MYYIHKCCMHAYTSYISLHNILNCTRILYVMCPQVGIKNSWTKFILCCNISRFRQCIINFAHKTRYCGITWIHCILYYMHFHPKNTFSALYYKHRCITLHYKLYYTHILHTLLHTILHSSIHTYACNIVSNVMHCIMYVCM